MILLKTITKGLLRNKLDKAGDVILCDNKAKNVVIAKAIARILTQLACKRTSQNSHVIS
ncbi:MAG: hypothetical protein L3J11_05410 [Draconibacterium sp.]|nr:hypothetical protein [Draconibacterium sp.]